MKPSTNIRDMMAKNTVYVPDYQRAYSWDTDTDSSKSQKQVNTFLSDLEEYSESKTKSPYYFGHFLFENSERRLGIIDGQQRLTTIVIFLAVLFRRLRSFRDLTFQEQQDYEDIIGVRSKRHFFTVEYDKVLFDNYVIEGKAAKSGLKTKSSERIVNAHDFFRKRLFRSEESYCVEMLENVKSAQCTTHLVSDKSEAIQMFVFQNSRGKKPSNLEIIKAQFMFNIHLHARDEEEKNYLLEEINRRFEEIYTSLSYIEHNINEDSVLLYTIKVHFDSLHEADVITKVNSEISEGDPLTFVEQFTQSIHDSFMHLRTFYCEDERDYHELHSIAALGRIGIAMPFIVKAYKFGLSKDDLRRLCVSLESLLVRHRLIRTRAVIESRLENSFKEFSEMNPSIERIITRIAEMKLAESNSDSWWSSYWNNDALNKAIEGGHVNHQIAKFILWKYENTLELSGKSGYLLTRFEKIKDPELEHISPIAPKGESPHNGYDVYDEEFRNQYLNCLGNYLLLSESHNRSLKNGPFSEKRKSYSKLEQQREIQRMTKVEETWTRNDIQRRNDILVRFIIDTF